MDLVRSRGSVTGRGRKPRQVRKEETVVVRLWTRIYQREWHSASVTHPIHIPHVYHVMHEIVGPVVR